MSLVAITGYASLDHVIMLDGKPVAGSTTMILERSAEWPRLGGGPAYVAAALARAGVTDVVPVSWVGADVEGEDYAAKLRALGVSDAGLARVAGGKTPLAILAYQPDGGCLCLYHTGMSPVLPLTLQQLDIVAKANWVCIMIGPREATDGVLGAIRPDARLAWVVKHSPTDMPFEHSVALASRADLITYSKAESAFVEDVLRQATPRPGRIAIETAGPAGARARRDDQTAFVPASPIAVEDPTGAGDSFAGGVLAALVRGESRLDAILVSGHAAASALLRTRTKR